MIETKSSLFVKCEIDNVFTDYSHKSSNFGKDSFSINLTVNDFIYVGYNKPINVLYVNHISSFVDEGMLSLQVFNGTEWVNASVEDDTFGLQRSGYVKFKRDLGQVASVVDDVSTYWYRFSSSIAREGLVLSGINLVFASDYDLLLEQPYITMDEFLSSSLKSHILTHVAVRNEILQKFRNKDYYKLDKDGFKQDLNQWDLIDIDEVKQAAIYLAISKIYFNMSDSSSDTWAVKSSEYRSKFESCIQAASLSLDFNDNGIKDIEEVKTQTTVRYLSR